VIAGLLFRQGVRVAIAVVLFWIAIPSPASRADEAVPIAATVGQDFVYVAEVEREVARVVNERPVEPLAKRVLQAKALQQLIDRRLIVHWLQSKGQAASPAEIDLSIQRLDNRLAQREMTLAQHLSDLKTSELELRRRLEWQIGWQRFLARYMTDAYLEKYFEQHRRDFDGTKLRVAHILLKIEGDDPHPVLDKARELRRRIADGQLTFAAAAMSHSAAPTGADGGDIGLISRREPMPESFSATAFALAEGEVSEPVVTAFGVHLIRCLEIQPGQKQWQDATGELREAIAIYLFQWAADRQRANSQIKFTGAIPHFRPGTEQLAE
jgi:parvulin-like peptidyl-prolyl isomerase